MKGTYCAYTPAEITRLRRGLYPNGFEVRPIEDQIRALAAALSLESHDALEFAANVRETTSNDVDGLFAMIRPDAFGSPEATLCVLLSVLRERRPFFRFDANELGPVELRFDPRTQHAFAQLAEMQAGPIVVLPAQLGIMYVGRNPEHGLAMLDANEFALGPTEVCSMILSHPKWYRHLERFHVLCPGSRYVRLDAPDDLARAHVPRFGDDEVVYDAVTMRYVRHFAGMATGFAPTSVCLPVLGPGL